MNEKVLLVIVPDRISDILKKGEYPELYYNPGDLFAEVHILMTNDDQPDLAQLQKTVGRARLFVHNLPSPKIRNTFGWQEPLIRPWIAQGIKIARQIAPSLVRTHNNFLEGYLASEIKQQLGVPFVTSLHGVWDRDGLITGRDKFIKLFRQRFERITMKNADAVIAVYEPIIRYAREYGAKNIHLIYNIVSGQIEKKQGNRLSSPPRLITINRQVKEKNPENIIRAITDIDCEYVIVGDGPYHEHLREVARESGCADKVRFISALPNAQICSMLKDFDLMVSHVDYWGMSKTVIEASLAGIPTVINHHPVMPIPEYQGDWLCICQNTPEGYRSAIRSLLSDDSARSQLAQTAYQHARSHFNPQAMEEKVVRIYEQVISSSNSKAMVES